MHHPTISVILDFKFWSHKIERSLLDVYWLSILSRIKAETKKNKPAEVSLHNMLNCYFPGWKTCIKFLRVAASDLD
jgi:hypothetical protein